MTTKAFDISIDIETKDGERQVRLNLSVDSADLLLNDLIIDHWQPGQEVVTSIHALASTLWFAKYSKSDDDVPEGSTKIFEKVKH